MKYTAYINAISGNKLQQISVPNIKLLIWRIGIILCKIQLLKNLRSFQQCQRVTVLVRQSLVSKKERFSVDDFVFARCMFYDLSTSCLKSFSVAVQPSSCPSYL